MLSGQGSQYYQMGRKLYDNDKIFQHHMQQLDVKMAKRIGKSVIEEVYGSGRDLSEDFDHTVVSGMAILLLELSLTRTLIDKGVTPDILLGSSFGTLVSTVVAGCIDEEEAIDGLASHGQLFEDHCEKGCMVAVLAKAEIYENDEKLQSLAQMVGINFETSFVLSMPMTNFDQVKAILTSLEVAYQKLPVTRAYHSHWIDSARDKFLSLYGERSWKKPRIPIVCTSRTLPLINVNPETLWHVVRGPIHFEKTAQWIEARGPHTYIDLGPSGTLATFLKYVLPQDSQSQSFQILSPYNNPVRSIDTLVTAMTNR